MAYSVVGAPALGFDLARLPGGDQVAGVLRVALAAGPDDLERLAACHPGAGARERLAPSLRRAAPTATPAHERRAAAGRRRARRRPRRGETALLRRLETGLLGDAHALDRLVRRDLLDWTWLHSGPIAVQDPIASLAADVLADAAAQRLPARPAPRATCAARWPARSCAPALPVARRDAVAIGAPRGRRPAGSPSRRRRRRRPRGAGASVVDELRVHTAQWAPAMHQATWALSLAERLRLACDAQLAGVIAFDRAGFSARDAAYGVWNAWSGVVQASAVQRPAPGAGGRRPAAPVARGVRRAD